MSIMESKEEEFGEKKGLKRRRAKMTAHRAVAL